MQESVNCPTCLQPTTRLGSAWFCLEHGPAYSPRPEPVAALTKLKHLFAEKRFSSVVSACDRLIRTHPEAASVYAYRGLGLEQLGWLREALENYNEAIALDPTYAAPFRDRGLLCLRMGDLSAAKRDFERYQYLRGEMDASLPDLIDSANKRSSFANRNAARVRMFEKAENAIRLCVLSFAVLVILLFLIEFPQYRGGLTLFLQIGLAIALMWILAFIWLWRQYSALSGNRFWRHVAIMARYTYASEQRKLIRSVSNLNLILIISLALGYRLPLLMYGLLLVLGLWILLAQLVPPTILFLGSSQAASAEAWSRIRAKTFPHRTIALLAIRDLRLHWADKDDLRGANFRTKDPCLWRLVVYPLMEMTPIIVVDGDCETPGVIEEAGRLIETGASQKTFFISRNSPCPVTARLAAKFGDQLFRLMDASAAPRLLRAMIVSRQIG